MAVGLVFWWYSVGFLFTSVWCGIEMFNGKTGALCLPGKRLKCHQSKICKFDNCWACWLIELLMNYSIATRSHCSVSPTNALADVKQEVLIKLHSTVQRYTVWRCTNLQSCFTHSATVLSETILPLYHQWLENKVVITNIVCTTLQFSNLSVEISEDLAPTTDSLRGIWVVRNSTIHPAVRCTSYS